MASSLNLKGLTIEIGGDVSNLQTALKSVNGEISNLQANLRTVESALKLDPSNVDALAQKQKLLTDAVAETANKLDLLKEAQRQADEVISNGGEVDQQAYRNLQSEIVRTESSLTDYENQLQNTESQLKNVGQESDNTTNETQELGDAFHDTGESGTSAVNSIAEALAAAGIAKILQEAGEAVYKLADSYSSATANIVEGTGATGDALKGLEESLYNVYYRVTDSEATIESVGNLLAEVNTRLGLTGDSLENTSVLISEFAEHTGIDAVSAVDMIVDIMKKWGLTIDDLPTLLDGLTVANQSCSLSMDEIGRLLVDNKAQFDALGYSVPQATALIVALADSGVNTSSVLTGMRNAINVLSKSTKDVPGAFNGMIQAIANCDNATDALNMKVGNTGKTVKEVFGAKAAQEMVTAIQSGNFAIEDWMKVLQNCDGALQQTADGANTLQDKWATASRNISGAFSQALTPIIEQASGKLADLVTKFGEFLQEHPGLVKAISAIAAAFGTLLGIASVITIVQKIISVFSAFSGVVTIIKGVGTAFSGLFSLIAANPVVAIITGIIGAIVLLYTKCEWFRNAVAAVWNAIKTAVETVANAIKAAWTAVSTALTNIWNGIKNAATTIWNGIKSTASTIWNGITSTISNIVGKGKETISKWWEAYKTEAKSKWESIKSTASTAWNGITSTISNFVEKGKNAVSKWWEAYKSDASSKWDNIRSKASSSWTNITGTIANLVQNGSGKISQLWASLRDKTVSSWDNIKAKAGPIFQQVGSTIINTLKNLPGKVVDIGKNLLSGLWEGIKDKGRWLKEKISDLGKSVLGWFKGIFGVHSPSTETAWIGEMLARGLWKGLDDSEGMLDRKADELSEGLLEKLSGLTDIDAGINGLAAMNGVGGFGSSSNPTEERFAKLLDAVEALRTEVRTERLRPVFINGRKLVGAIADDMDDALGEIQARKEVGAL